MSQREGKVESLCQNLINLNENEIAKIIGLTVDVKMTNEEVITGVVFSVFRYNNILILLKPDDNDSSTLNSIIINLKHLENIKLNNLVKIEVIRY